MPMPWTFAATPTSSIRRSDLGLNAPSPIMWNAGRRPRPQAGRRVLVYLGGGLLALAGVWWLFVLAFAAIGGAQ